MAEVHFVGIVLFDGFEELDAVGPLEVFGAACTALDRQDDTSRPRYRPVTVSVPGNERGRTVRGSNGMEVVATHAGDDPDMPPLDIILVPGGQGTRSLHQDRRVAEWLAELCKGAKWVTSVCTGVLLLHAAGIAAGKKVATHFAFEDKLESMGGLTVVRDQRWVVDGSLVTSQGVSAGIDMSLWLVGQLYSPEHSRLVQKDIQYHPAPPFQHDSN